MIMTARVSLGWVDLADIEADAEDDANAEEAEA